MKELIKEAKGFTQILDQNPIKIKERAAVKKVAIKKKGCLIWEIPYLSKRFDKVE